MVRVLAVALAVVATAAGLFVEGLAQEVALSNIYDASGQAVGAAILLQTGSTLELDIKMSGLQPGPHGIHIHAVGKCEGPDFSSAGPHFNPGGAQHGLQNPAGPHAGDLPNVEVEADGSAVYQTITELVTLLPGEVNSLLDDDGAAIVIHASADDLTTDPSGNSGARIACGIIERIAEHTEEELAEPERPKTTQPEETPAAGFQMSMTTVILGLLALALLLVIILRVL